MPRRLVEAWLQHCIPVLEGENGLTHWELLFLICNAHDRADLIEKKLPHGKFRTDKDAKMQTYNFDVGLKHSRAPDSWLQELTNPAIDAQRIMFEYETYQKPPSPKRRKNKRYTVHSKREEETVSQYRKLLRDPNLFNEIKGRISESNSFVVLARQPKVKESHLRSRIQTPGLERLSVSRPRSKHDLKRLHTSVGPDCGHRFSKSRPISAGRAQSMMSSNHSYVWEAAIELAEKNEASRIHMMRPFSAKSNITSGSKSSNRRNVKPLKTALITSMSGVRPRQLDIPIRQEPFKVLNLRETTALQVQEARQAEAHMMKKPSTAL